MTSESSIEIHHTRIILRTAIASRVLLIALIILWRSLLSPYDTSASINPVCLSRSSPNSTSILFPRIASAIGNSIVWDGVYFVRIAQCGYEYEQSYAFLPLLPLCITLLSRTVFALLIPVIGYRAVLGLSGYVISNVAFVLAAICLYRLSVTILKDREGALRASILFCFNPASIFYSSIYTESLYSLLSIGGLYQFMSGANNVATLLLALSGTARSNGVITADQMRPWCKARVPLLYNYIQSHYWGVGFLRYFQLKQLPNFLLASPILSLALCSIIHYVKLQPEIFFSLGFRGSPEDNDSASVSFPTGSNTREKGGYFLEEHSSRIHQDTIASCDLFSSRFLSSGFELCLFRVKISRSLLGSLNFSGSNRRVLISACNSDLQGCNLGLIRSPGVTWVLLDLFLVQFSCSRFAVSVEDIQNSGRDLGCCKSVLLFDFVV
ncbi:hypothetical protein TEA_022742 [Camellia sinensis var. sinensis]|uniref:GPI mannosyltransferase 2 n=1 Tax=Camellia sinensis var. sinensis TaxID=542762 RepID=A0A4V6RYT1_CAMSN|nr:hypothetical protein TEA_022742 [Camellia sinensis var. sinensis]